MIGYLIIFVLLGILVVAGVEILGLNDEVTKEKNSKEYYKIMLGEARFELSLMTDDRDKLAKYSEELELEYLILADKYHTEVSDEA